MEGHFISITATPPHSSLILVHALPVFKGAGGGGCRPSLWTTERAPCCSR